MNYRDLLTVFYGFITILGVILLGFSWYCWSQSLTATAPISYWLAAGILFIMGIVLIMFGIETYLFRDDPDVWR